MVRKILAAVPIETLQKDLEKYRQRALEIGATDAKIITTDMVLVDERVRAKCIYPKCRHYGTNANCPPYAMDLDTVRKIARTFHYAIFYSIKVAPETVAGPDVHAKNLNQPSRMKNREIASKIEAEAFFDGYHLAVSFAGGACKDAFCPNDECTAIIPGKACRHPLRARSAMEGVGINAFQMAANVGWDVYPIGRAISPSEVPHGLKMGLVFIY